MSLARGNLFKSDLDEILKLAGSFNSFQDSRILVLGGTGFVGTWLVSALLHANESLNLDLKIDVITRDVPKAKVKLMLNNSDPINLYDFDLQYKVSLPTVEYDYYVHAATPSIISTGSSNASLVSGSTFGGTKLISDNIRKFRNNPSVLHTSSGAVYGRQLFSERNQLEIDAKSELDLDTNYSKAKVSTEILLNDLNTNSIAKVSNPRLFAFAGPRIELNEHFAIGNFVRDGLNGEKIHVKGNPSTIRSYLYPTELTSWLIKLMISPSSENINIGSEISYSMTELATMVSNLTSKKGVLFANQNSEASIYVPSTINAQEILKVTEKVCLEIGLERWIRWLELTKR